MLRVSAIALTALLVCPPSSLAQPEPLGDGSGLTYPLDLKALGLTVPRIEGDPVFDKMLRDKHVLWYRLPPAWQQDLAPNVAGKTRPTWGVFSTSLHPDRHANDDFPWRNTIGLDSAFKLNPKGDPYGAVNFLRLPDDGQGGVLPILVLTTYPVCWLFPPGTLVGEVIYVVHNKRKHVQEIRVRKKADNSKTWFPSVYRPCGSRKELEEMTSLPSGKLWGKRRLSFRNPEEDEVFKLEGLVDVLPDLPADEVERVLKMPFKDVTAANWSPAASIDFHVLPRDYSFGLLGAPDSQVCSGCHRQTQTSVRELIPREPSVAADPAKMGSIRGSDAVFTWHPFHAQALAKGDGKPYGNRAPTRPWDRTHGVTLVKDRDYDGPLPADYRLTLFVQESLASYELPPARYLHPPPARKGHANSFRF